MQPHHDVAYQVYVLDLLTFAFVLPALLLCFASLRARHPVARVQWLLGVISLALGFAVALLRSYLEWRIRDTFIVVGHELLTTSSGMLLCIVLGFFFAAGLPRAPLSANKG